MTWQPTKILRYIRSVDSSTKVARVRTDAGDAYMKAMGNPEGSHALARDFIGTSLAKWFGLPVFEFAIVEHDGVVDIPFDEKDRFASAGPAFLTRSHEGGPWSGSSKDLKRVENLEIITMLVIFDTWVRNRDRCPPEGMGRRPNYDNVFFSTEGASSGTFRIMAMDFTHCFSEADLLNQRVADIGNIQDEQVYGLFKPFIEHLQADILNEAIQRLSAVNAQTVSSYIKQVPKEWQLDSETRKALEQFLIRRADFLINHLHQMMIPYVGTQGDLGEV
jgi:hypothetical protein